MYSEFRDTGNKYKMRIRSRVSNLGDLKNPGLRQNVISGHITPERIAVMTSEVGNIFVFVDVPLSRGLELAKKLE